MKEEMRENLIDEGIWMRGVFMVLFLIAYNIVEFLILLAALFQVYVDESLFACCCH